MGTNGEFGGPTTMSANGGLLTAMSGTCNGNGINFDDITNITWKLFVTPVEISDRNRREKQAVVQAGGAKGAPALVPSGGRLRGGG